MERFEESISTFQRVIEINPDDYRGHYFTAKAVLRLAFHGGEHLSGRERLIARGEALLERALALNPTFDPAHGLKGDLLTQQNRLDEALASYREAFRIGRSPQWVSRAATVQLRLERFDEAAAGFRYVTTVEPSDATALYRLGVALMGQGDLEAAGEALHRARSLDPAMSEVDAALHRLRTMQMADR